MKRRIAASITMFLVSLSTFSVFTIEAEADETEYWALIVCGSPGLYPQYPTQFLNNTYYMNHTLHELYDFTEIKFIERPGSKMEVRKGITSWLRLRVDANDVVFIYFSSHGGGHDIHSILDGRYDNKDINEPGEYPDEGNEIHESTIGWDVNNDTDTDDWIGIDEQIVISHAVNETLYVDEFYWDDELAYDLDYLKNQSGYEKLIFVRQGSYPGGLIDDISAPNRIIMTPANETTSSRGDLDGDGFSEWSEAFIDALHGLNTTMGGIGEIIHDGDEIDADVDNDGHVSMLEAWEFAWNNDTARLRGKETPWMDDNGDGYPTFANETDVFLPGDGTPSGLAANTWLPLKGHADITVQSYYVENNNQTLLENVTFRVDDDPTEWNTTKTLTLTQGNHTVAIDSSFLREELGSTYLYIFDHWEDNSTDAERQLNLTNSKIITAYYQRFDQGGGCPFIYTWNGSQYLLDNNLLPASETSGEEDVEDHYVLQQSLASWNDRYRLRISEFEREHSYFDQVKLLAVDHDSDIDVAVSSSGEILTFRDPNEPVSAVDNHGSDVLDLLQEVDESYYEGQAGDSLLLDFGDLDIEDGAKLILRADPPGAGKWSIFVQVRNSSMLWETVSIVLPRVYWATEIVDLSNWLPDSNGDLKVRLMFTNIHRVDYVGLDTTSQEVIELYEGNLLRAIHSEQGFVGWRLRYEDQVYAELLPGQTIRLTFYLPLQDNPEKKRTFVLYSRGRYFTIP